MRSIRRRSSCGDGVLGARAVRVKVNLAPFRVKPIAEQTVALGDATDAEWSDTGWQHTNLGLTTR